MGQNPGDESTRRALSPSAARVAKQRQQRGGPFPRVHGVDATPAGRAAERVLLLRDPIRGSLPAAPPSEIAPRYPARRDERLTACGGDNSPDGKRAAGEEEFEQAPATWAGLWAEGHVRQDAWQGILVL